MKANYRDAFRVAIALWVLFRIVVATLALSPVFLLAFVIMIDQKQSETIKNNHYGKRG